MDADREAIRRELEPRSTDELLAILDSVADLLEARGVSLDDDGEEPATLGQFFNSAEAHAHRMALEEAGIESWVSDEIVGSGFSVGIGTRLMVRAEDLPAAREVLKDGAAGSAAMPADMAEPPCPQCGSREVTQVAEVPDPLSVPAEWARREWRFRCNACAHEWPEPIGER